MELILASGNKHKLQEFQNKTPPAFRIASMMELGVYDEIDEYGQTLEDNARIKAEFIHQMFEKPCFADDSGLEIDALNGQPGVYSARFAGKNCTYEDNNKLVLKMLKGIQHRQAKFKTVIHLIIDKDHQHTFIGQVNGTITQSPKGTNGFGYDPIFQPEGFDLTYAEFTLKEKNEISHRAKAVEKLVEFLRLL